MGAGRGGAEGEKRNETVGRGGVCVCDHTACVRSCLSHTHRTPGRAAPSSKRERSRTQIYSQRTTTAAEGPRARQGRQQESPPQRRSGSNEAGRDGRHHAHHAGRQQADHQQHQKRHRLVVTALVHWRGNRAIDASMGGANPKPDTRSQMGCRQRKEGAVRTTYCAWRQCPSDLSLHRTPSRMYCRARRCR